MPKLYGDLEKEDRLLVHTISYSGNKPGFVEVEEVLEGDGQLYVNPLTGEQWLETEVADPKLETLEQKVDRMLALLEGGGVGEMGS